MAIVGAMFGQLVFGVLADQLGRRVMFVTTCACIIIGTTMSAAVQPARGMNIYQQLVSVTHTVVTTYLEHVVP
jgi:MFS family permease